MNKICPCCKISKRETDFYYKYMGYFSEQSYCKDCSKVKQKIATKRVHLKYRKRNMEWLLSHIGSPIIWCDRCKYRTSFSAIDFHHVDPKQKEGKNDSLGYWLGFANLEKFQNKILNTRFWLLCKNCHAEYHAGVWKQL